MNDPLASYGTAMPSPNLVARVREAAAYLAAPSAGWLTEEQRALTLGIARRLTLAASDALDLEVDTAGLWHDWLVKGLPSATRLAAACFARAEEHRWREVSQQMAVPGEGAGEAAEGDGAALPTPRLLQSETDRAYLALRIADRRRFDALGNPSIAIADLDLDLYRTLLRDIANWCAATSRTQSVPESAGSDAVEQAAGRQQRDRGIDAAAQDYHRKLLADAGVSAAAATAIRRHDWPALIALLASAHRRGYADMAMALMTSDMASLSSMFLPLGIAQAELAPLEASLARLPGRLAPGGAVATRNSEDGA